MPSLYRVCDVVRIGDCPPDLKAMSSAFTIRHITVADALAVRLDVLRRGTPSQDAAYDGDDEPHTAHIGAAIGNEDQAATLGGLSAAGDHGLASWGRFALHQGDGEVRRSECSSLQMMRPVLDHIHGARRHRSYDERCSPPADYEVQHRWMPHGSDRGACAPCLG